MKLGQIAFLSLPPPDKNKYGGVQRAAFSSIEQHIWDRMARKPVDLLEDSDKFINRPTMPGAKPLVFKSFEELGNHIRQGHWISKLYLLAHGYPSGIEMPDKKILDAKSIKNQLVDTAGLSHQLKNKGSPFELKIRLLACETGMPDTTHEAKLSFAEQLRNYLQRDIAVMIHKNEIPKITYKITIKAPLGWQLNWNDGTNIAYRCAAKERAKVEDQLLDAFKKNLVLDKTNPPKAVQNVANFGKEAHLIASTEILKSTDNGTVYRIPSDVIAGIEMPARTLAPKEKDPRAASPISMNSNERPESPELRPWANQPIRSTNRKNVRISEQTVLKEITNNVAIPSINRTSNSSNKSKKNIHSSKK